MHKSGMKIFFGGFQHMKFFQLDPRPQGADANTQIFRTPCGVCGGQWDHRDGLDVCPFCHGTGFASVFGIEVTVPALASQCAANLDHHGLGDTAETPSACEQAFRGAGPLPTRAWDVPVAEQMPMGADALVTVRPDADSVTAMAVIWNREMCLPIDAELVSAVGRFDRLGPSAGKPAAVVSAIARKAADFKLSLEARVKWVSEILAGDSKEAEVAELISTHDSELEAARAASEVVLCAGGRIVTVVSTHRFGTSLGYEMAQVVIAMNPEFLVDPKDSSKGTVVKFTVCRYDSHVACDLSAALAELQQMEPGWGGRGDIFGSPQGVSSKLSLEQVLEVVTRHLK